MQQTQESEQHYILHDEAPESSEKYNAGKLKRMTGQYQTYGEDSDTGSRRTN